MRTRYLGDTTRVLSFLLVSSTDKTTPITGISPTVTLSKNGGTFNSCTGTVSEVANGWYKLVPSVADVNTLGSLVLHATGTGADPTDVEFDMIAIDPFATSVAVEATSTRAAIGMNTANLDTQLETIANADANLNTTQTWDGITTAKLYKALIAMLAGKVVVTDNGSTKTLSFKAQDGSSEAFSITAAEFDGARDSTGTIS